MWYLRKLATSCQQFGPVSTCLCPKYIKFCYRNLEKGREDKYGFNWAEVCDVSCDDFIFIFYFRFMIFKTIKSHF